MERTAEGVRAYMVLDLWRALGHDEPSLTISAPDVDHAQVWADLIDQVRGLRAELGAARADIAELAAIKARAEKLSRIDEPGWGVDKTTLHWIGGWLKYGDDALD